MSGKSGPGPGGGFTCMRHNRSEGGFHGTVYPPSEIVPPHRFHQGGSGDDAGQWLRRLNDDDDDDDESERLVTWSSDRMISRQ